MPTADMPWRQGKNPRFDYIATRLAHWTPAMFVFVAAWFFVFPLVAPRDAGWLVLIGLGIVCALPMSITLALATTVHSWHMYAMCPVCARKIPLNPKTAVKAKRRPLQTLHWIADKHAKAHKRTQIALLILSFVPWVGVVAFPALMLSTGYLLYLGNIHMRLQPWCPQCRWEGGGDKEVAPDPDPVGADQKVS
jgi:hypothetical protein